MTAASPRRSPCASCPYRKNVPSGVWHPDEYAKLPRYDEDTSNQPTAAFMCHQGDGDVCSGWLGHADPGQLLAVRIGVSTGSLDPACFDYETAVPLFKSGADAAEHGLRQVEAPGADAVSTMSKIERKKALQ